MEDSSSGSPSQQTQDIQISHYTLVFQPRFVILSRTSKAVIDLVSFTRASALSFLHRRASTNVLDSYIPICLLYPCLRRIFLWRSPGFPLVTTRPSCIRDHRQQSSWVLALVPYIGI